MTRAVVNLDALLPREDLAVPSVGSYANIPGLKITDLEQGLIYNWLRKPDFQRETDSWSPEQVADLIESFAKGNIIPAIILWQNGQRVFVVDGAHRLSALIAWVHNDYGAGDISSKQFHNAVPEQQRVMDAMTRSMVQQKIGSYETHKQAAANPKNADVEVLARATQFPYRSIDVQWIRDASVNQARDAFFRINKGGTQIDPVETRILRAKDSALAITARAISRGGEGHAYWEIFPQTRQDEIKSISKELYKLLFTPPLYVPIKTLDVPVAGFGYGDHILPFAFDLTAMSNKLPIPDSSRKKAEDKDLTDDPDGEETVDYLKRARKLVRLICSNDPSSLGLHPALYFYTGGGTFQPVAFFNTASWFMELNEKNELEEFLGVRESFEKLILDHPVIVKPAVHKLGSGGRTRSRMVALYQRIFGLLIAGRDPRRVWNKITAEDDFAFLITDDSDLKEQAHAGTAGGKFSRKAKSASFIETSLSSAPRCSLCGGLLHTNGMVVHHKQERSRGGSSASENAAMVHPLCNSLFRSKSGK